MHLERLQRRRRVGAFFQLGELGDGIGRESERRQECVDEKLGSAPLWRAVVWVNVTNSRPVRRGLYSPGILLVSTVCSQNVMMLQFAFVRVDDGQKPLVLSQSDSEVPSARGAHQRRAAGI